MNLPDSPRILAPRSHAIVVTAVYAVLAAAWIYASDALLGRIVFDPVLFSTLSMYKGWVFVAFTSALLYAHLRNSSAKAAEEPGAEDDGPFNIWLPLLIFVLFVGIVTATGYLAYRNTARAAKVRAEETLGAVADLKVHQIADWMNERRGNAERISHDPFMAPEAEAWLSRGAPEDATAARLRARLDGLRSARGWDRISLLDRQGEPRMTVGVPRAYSQLSRTLALQAIASRETVFSDFHRHDQQIELGFFAPLLVGTGDQARSIGAVAMEIDPQQYLYPLIQSWPLPSRSGETLLVRREGNFVVFLNDLRLRKGSTLSLRFPLTSKLVAAQAVLGARGPLEERDYRGIPVLACARRVPGTSWVLVAKVDLQEVKGPVAENARLMAIIGLVLVLAAALATALWLRQQRAIALVRQYRAERERTVLEKHLDTLTRYANDMILIMDDEGRILDANERAVAAYGFPREELLRMNVRSLRAPAALETFESDWQKARWEDGVVFETIHRRSDGTAFPVEVSSRGIRADDVTLRQSIIRDISERKEADGKIRRLSNLYAALSQMNQAIVRGKRRQELLGEICRVAVEYGRLHFAWVGSIDEHDGRVKPAATYGPDSGYLAQITVLADPAQPTGRGPIGRTLREGHTQVCNDIFTDPSMIPWRAAAAQSGFRSIATLPLLEEGKIVAVLAVYADEPGFFDNETIALLEEMCSDVSFGLENLAKEERRRAAEAALRESEEKYRLLFSSERDAIVLFDADSTRILDANEAFLALSGYTAEETTQLRVQDVSADPDATRDSLRNVRERGFDHVDVRLFRRKDGTALSVEISLNTFVWRGRRLVTSILRDITERMKAEESARLWARVLEDSAEGIVITDTDRRILTVNKAFTALTGYAPEEVIGSDPKVLSSGRHEPAFYHVMWRTIRESGRWQGEIWNRRKSGEVYLEWLSITAVRNDAGQITHYVGIFTDITERKESADRIEFLANHDFLTGLPNRSLMNDLARQAVATTRRKGSNLALLFLDLDRFKTINDSLGHPAGDVLLQRVASRLTDCVREGDTVARLGGDEFLIMLPELARSQDAALVAEKIVQAMHKPIYVQEHELAITASIGISICPHDGFDVPTLVKNADAAMYHAKERGRNNFQFFTPDMNARAFEALSVEMSLRGALERNEFTLHYQPQIQILTGRIIGAEALIRWNHRDLGFVSPGKFIPVAEEHGLIVPIGDWVLRTACAQVRQWLDEGLPAVPVAVNVSAVQFRQPGLATRVAEILEQTGLAPEYLELELTESIIMREAEQSIEVLLELHDMGISLSIDDFGTGYSSLSYLRRFPIHKLKIDQSFVRDINTNPDAAAIATAIIGMGKSLKLRVIAEGVETAEQQKFLESLQCDELQGFHIGRPTEAEKFSALLRTSGSVPA